MSNTETLNNQFYPTPPAVISRMLGKISRKPCKILEPSAGTGDIVDRLSSRFKSWKTDINAIEIDDNMQATLRGKGIKVIDSDFLSFAGPDKFDLIIANPPFNRGAEHLLKAIDIMFSGEIVFLLNAETIRNPHSNARKLLARKLEELNADIEYIDAPFMTAERTTSVEVALVYINIERRVECDLFEGVTEATDLDAPEVKQSQELTTGRMIEELVIRYNKVVEKGTETIIAYYQNYTEVHKYISLNDEGGKDSSYYEGGTLTEKLQNALNIYLGTVRVDFWRHALELKEVRRQLTEKKQDEFESAITKYSCMDFTEYNIRRFVLNLLKGHTDTLTEATLEVFQMFTRHGYRDQDMYEKNIHYFDGWKTNDAFKVGKKVIIPIYGYCGEAFISYGIWKLDYHAARKLRDIDIVMNYFDGFDGEYRSIAEALEHAFIKGEGTAESTYFNLKAHKKGTLHLTFKDKDILRRFNIAACLGKGWLPPTYGQRAFNELPHAEQVTVKEFEGKESYEANLGTPVFGESNLIQLAI